VQGEPTWNSARVCSTTPSQLPNTFKFVAILLRAGRRVEAGVGGSGMSLLCVRCV
jgi:hypothetical protein